jgi:UDP:flavonoid glycosyltransferase YjiC (YdhE family)
MGKRVRSVWLDDLVRMLFTFAGGTGHFLPLVPVARAAADAGHVVAFAGQERMVPTIERAGFTAFPSGGASLLLTDQRAPLLPMDMEREARVVRTTFAGRIAHERADSILAVCAEWSPDVVVRDEIDFGSVVAAERLGLPHATILCIASGSFVTRSLVVEPLNDLRARHDLPADPDLAMLDRYLVLSPFPASFRDPRFPPSPNTHLFRSVTPDGSADGLAPTWLRELSDGPIVYLTLGTIFNLESGDLFERALAGLGELPGYVVVTVGREIDPQSLGPQPANVVLRGYVPQSLLLPHCNLVVSHGGSGSVIGALTHGLPMVLLPMGADQPLNAARAQQLEVAQVLDAIDATPAAIQQAATTVMTDPTYRQNAEKLQYEICALPGPEHAVALLEQLNRERAALPATS